MTAATAVSYAHGMFSDDPFLQELATTANLGWWTSQKLRRREADPWVIEALLARLAHEQDDASLATRVQALQLLAEYVARQRLGTELAQPRSFAALLAELATERRSWLALQDGYFDPAQHIARYYELLLPGSAAGRPLLRDLLAEPARLPSSADPSAQQSWTAARGVALRLLEPLAEPTDAALLRSLWETDLPAVAAPAAVVWHRVAGAAVLPAIAARALAPHGPSRLAADDWYYSLARLGEGLLEPCLEALRAAEYDTRAYAVRLLSALRELAVPRLREIARDDADWRVRSNAGEALTAIYQQRLATPAAAVDAADRGLSLAEPAGDAERGLSRADEG
ncbi:MAG: hypothetical protein IT204_08025 [Fimbriimonadaceae bacterium]|nr:hypothetical protein [Fimbriimonadaceae bacterium]